MSIKNEDSRRRQFDRVAVSSIETLSVRASRCLFERSRCLFERSRELFKRKYSPRYTA